MTTDVRNPQPPVPTRLVKSPPPETLEPLFPCVPVLKASIARAEAIAAERDTILRDARAEAERIRADAQHEAEQAVRTAVRIAESDAAERTHSLHEVLTSAADAIEHDVAARSEAIAVEIARAVIRAEVRTNTSVVVELVLEAIRAARTDGSVRVRVHPDTADALGTAIDWHQSERVALVPDPRVAPDAVRVETNLGVVADGFSERIDDIADRLHPGGKRDAR